MAYFYWLARVLENIARRLRIWARGRELSRDEVWRGPSPRSAGSSELFGAFRVNIRATVENYMIEPVEDFSEVARSLENELNCDEFLYPPVSETWHLAFPGTGRPGPIPKTSRPANIHPPFVTHAIRTLNGEKLPDDFRSGDGALILRLLDVIYETQLTFHDWFWVGRVPMHKGVQTWLSRRELEVALASALNTWRQWNPEERRRYLNCCFHFSRSITYEWEYEKFMALYTCLDGLWRLLAIQNGWGRIPHAHRLSRMIGHFELHPNEDEILEIVRLRNDLFHEGLWGQGTPMGRGPDGVFSHIRQLKELVHRLLLATVGLRNSYIKSNWESHRGWKRWDASS